AEIVARLHALLRRQSGAASQILKHRDLQLDVSAARLTKGGVTVDLTTFEYKMLRHFMLRPGRLVSQADLATHLYAQEAEKDSNTLEVYISRLRRKL
ncbi:winged helix-turn-helix domain-containing protein, partial [Streptomyces niveiscabiei]